MKTFLLFLSSVVKFIVSVPGEDASRNVNVSWHCFSQGSYVELTDSRDSLFSNAGQYLPEETLWYAENCDSLFARPRYVCRCSFTDLEPGHTYKYRVCTDGFTSETYHFTTASGARRWKFNAFTDFQPHDNPYTHPLVQLIDSLSGHAPLSICSGDMIDYAAYEKEWDWLFSKKDFFSRFLYASSPGDHEYWGLQMGKHIAQLPEPCTYKAIFNFPKNGPDCCKGSCYWFIYNNILFVSLDCGDSNTPVSDKSIQQKEWFLETVKSLKGRYDYLVVFQHKSLMASYTNDTGVHKRLTPLWVPAYEEAGVDLVLSGHDHMYSRTREINGVWYLDMGSSGSKTRVPDEGQYSDGLHEKIINLRALSQCVGAVVEVGRKSMDIKVYNRDAQLVDSFSIKAKKRKK